MQKDIYDEVMQNHNPLMQIHIGTPDEVWEVRKLAREIVSSVNFRFSSLYCSLERIRSLEPFTAFAYR